MSTFQDIKQAVKALSAADRTQLLDWMAVNLDVGLFVTEPPTAYGAAVLERDFYSLEEYLELEENSTMAYEYVAGQLYALTAASPAHEIITGNLYAAIHLHLRDRPCRVHLAERRIVFRCREDDIAYRPDVWVGCEDERNGKGMLVEEPRLVIEVLSPSTARIDRREKAVNYREIPSLEECVLVSQKCAQVILYRRAEGWSRVVVDTLDATLELRSIGLTLPIAQIYDKIP